MKLIFIIDHDKDLLALLEYFLTSNGYKVTTSIQTMSVEKVYGLKPDIILIDHLLNGIGAIMCFIVKQHPYTKHIPVILYSAHTNLKTISIQNSADAYIEKPFDIAYLERTVDQLIQ